MMWKRGVAALLIASVVVVGGAAAQQDMPSADAVRLERVAQGFTRPLLVTHAGDGSGRLFVLQQGGRVRIVTPDGAVLEPPFLDLTALVSPDANTFLYSERGLLGLAFAPDYANSGRLYASYTDTSGNSVVARYRVRQDDANQVDPASAEIILTQAQPFPNHNGGMLAFGPDGYLYVGFGDGGSQGDPYGNAQNLGTWLGKILRIDVSGEGPGYAVPEDNPFVGQAGALPEIWAYGLRNPWRFSFDMATGDLWIADVGGSSYEEVNRQPAASPGGENYGWNTWEGMHETGLKAPASNVTMPIAEYDHGQGVSVTGGYVYRGAALPALDGVYLYGDWGSGTIWSAWQGADGTWQSAPFMRSTGHSISAFGQDEAGELYLVDYNGQLLRFATG